MKRVIAFLILTFIIITTLLAMLSMNKDQSISIAVKRDHTPLDVVYIDDVAIALAGSPSSDIEMRNLAVAAYELTNEYRENQGINPLIWSEHLAQDAMVRAQELEKRFSHTRPNNTDWYTVDSEYMYGENLAQGFGDADGVVTAWINSPSHKANLEDSEFQTCGISAWRGSDGNIYIAQEFGY